MDDGLLYQVVFVSHSRSEVDEATLRDIQHKAATHNAASGVTGVLLASRGYFLQVLEGPYHAITSTLGRIAMDPRHENLTVLYTGTTRTRRTGYWSMGVLDTRPLPWAVDIMEMARRLTEAQADARGGEQCIDALVRGFEQLTAYSEAA
ncbi:MAG: hypothetical protein KatS3mg103_1024 [Phycisphaerales bacterium]|nr:MAG: hypothetical protein KatS3mg103_1024 [Phycisphaerales bacterium]